MHFAKLVRPPVARAVIAILLVQAAAAFAAPTAQEVEFFEKKIRPILASECYECHGQEKQKGGLRLDYRDATLKGGETGAAIVPKDPKKSLLIQAITHENAEIKMPKKRPKLDAAVIDDFIAWVKMGAPDPRNEPSVVATNSGPTWQETLALRKKWWSLQPVKKPPVPGGADGSMHPVDRFLQAKLSEHGLQMALPADKRSLVRRLSFAVTGLPPERELIEQFLNDESPEAYEKLVDQFLRSPRFGERWARHWMDLVRYAETHGSEGDPEIPEAWRYRDYLIRAFNADVPCDQLIREQIAGDLLPKPRINEAESFNESILGIANLRFVEHGFQPVDALDDQVKVVENQIDVLGKAFQGLTLACARCHDHKFDAISQKDFYALYGIFASCRPTMVTIDTPEQLRVHRAELRALKQKIRNALSDSWTATVSNVSSYLAHAPGGPQSPDDALNEEILGFEQQLATMERAAIRGGLLSRTNPAPLPFAAWTFEGNARDVLGEMDGEVLGGAEIKNGRLVLDGKSAFVRTAPLKREIRAKTLEAWVVLANREQAGGGAVTIETQNGMVFDSIVFGEQEPGKWIAGSDLFRRTRSAGGPPETSTELVHLAITYGTNNNIAIYRNGVPYGFPYLSTGDEHAKLQSYAAGSARVLLGMRHTGGGNAFLAGEIESAALYDRALNGKEIENSFAAGPLRTSAHDLATTRKQDQEERSELSKKLEGKRHELAKRFPNYQSQAALRERWNAAVAGAKEVTHPLYALATLRNKAGAEFTSAWQSFAKLLNDEIASRQKFNRDNFKPGWNLAHQDDAKWFKTGVNFPHRAPRPGDFSIEPEGNRVITGLYPAGVYTHLFSQKHAGVLTSPRFKIETDSIDIRGLGGKGARVRLIVENYPLGAESIYPQADLKSDKPEWLRLDTAYRKGSQAYLEFDTAETVLSRNRPAPGKGGRSYFGAQQVVFSDSKAIPRDESIPSAALLAGDAPKSNGELGQRYSRLLATALGAWRSGVLDEKQRVFLDFFVRNDLLPNTTNLLADLGQLVTEYRRIETEVPVARRSPGVLETVAYDALFLPRGDHTRPGAPVPRQYLQAFGSRPYRTKMSGRLELANEITSAANPLTARVMANRIWQHLFGRGIVATVDNFGRLGEQPSHPELLDFLAARFVERGWSIKEMIRFLVMSRAWQMSSEAPARAQEIDPLNELVSHIPAQRLEAELIRDSLLSVAGRLDNKMFGPSANALAAPADQTRRSIYLMVRRTNLSPFLQVFDAPKPFTTLGKREVTNVPAQSLALLNDPFVLELSARWAQTVIAEGGSADDRIRKMFERALSRPPGEMELAASRAFLNESNAAQPGKDLSSDEAAWTSFAQSLFNLKEFIYVR